MRETTNGSIVIISHQERILEIADEIVVISDGSILSMGPGMRACRRFWERPLRLPVSFYRGRHKHG